MSDPVKKCDHCRTADETTLMQCYIYLPYDTVRQAEFRLCDECTEILRDDMSTVSLKIGSVFGDQTKDVKLELPVREESQGA